MPETVRMGGSVKLRICCEARSKSGPSEPDQDDEDGLTDIDAPATTLTSSSTPSSTIVGSNRSHHGHASGGAGSVSVGSLSPPQFIGGGINNERMLQSPSLSHDSSGSPFVKGHQRTPSTNSSSMASPRSIDERVVNSLAIEGMEVHGGLFYGVNGASGNHPGGSLNTNVHNSSGTSGGPNSNISNGANLNSSQRINSLNGRAISVDTPAMPQPPRFRAIYPLTPNEGTVLGGTRVTIHGLHFDQLQNPVVYFGKVPAELVTISHHDVMECTTPPAENLKPGMVQVQIASLTYPLPPLNGGGSYIPDRVDYMYMAPPDYDFCNLAATSLSYSMSNEYPQDNAVSQESDEMCQG